MLKRHKKNIYLDWAASAPTSSVALKAFTQTVGLYGNPGALHKDAQQALTVLESARTKVARLGQVKPAGVVFTSGATEANALSILGSVRARRKELKEVHVLYHPGAHSSVLGAIEMLQEEGVEIEALALRKGILDISAIEKQLKANTALVVVEAVSGETGAIFDTLALRRILDAHKKKTGKRILLHVDASQAPTCLSISLPHLGADLLSLDAQKVGGVRGVGALLIAGQVELSPLMKGGGQEGGLRPGTSNVALIEAFAVALEDVQTKRETAVQKNAQLREKFLSEIQTILGVRCNESTDQASHIVNISLIGRDTDYLVLLLDARGYSVSTKSACESDEPESRMVMCITGEVARATSTLRVSWGAGVTLEQLQRFTRVLTEEVRFLDEKTIY